MTHPAQRGSDDSVTILMGVRNGAVHLPEQLESIAAQTHTNWRLKCSDDGSTDDSLDVLATFAAQHVDKVKIAAGPQDGFSANFMSLIRSLPDDIGHIGFADQDDVWEFDKLMRGITALEKASDIPTLYCGKTCYWYPETGRKYSSHSITKPPSFRNALIENVAAGNTIMLNPAAARLARYAAQRTDCVFAHDWWLYLLITGAGGKVIFDQGEPSLLYRQHGGNVIGAGQGITQQARRKIMVLKGAFAQRLDSNLTAMNLVRDLLTPENRTLLDTFSAARQTGVFGRLSALYKVKPYRQTLAGNIGFWGAAGLGYI
ncbi:MAG: glycosyltransferase [Sulfitobacter sp.]